MINPKHNSNIFEGRNKIAKTLVENLKKKVRGDNIFIVVGAFMFYT